MKICFDCGAQYDGSDFRCDSCGHAPPEIDGFPCLAPDLARRNKDFDDGIFECFSKTSENHFMLRYRNRLVVRGIRKFFSDRSRFLEVGCGSGMVLCAMVRAFPEMIIHASEISTRGLKATREGLQTADVTLFQMDARRMPFDGEYDVVGMFDVLEHIEDDREVLRNVHRALTPDGGLLITVPQHPFLWSAADEAVHHKRRYTRPEMVEKLTAAGFRVLRMTSYNFFLMPAMMINRYVQKDDYDIAKEWLLNPAVNAALVAVSSFENLFINLGLNFPVGGSLFCVARKD